MIIMTAEGKAKARGLGPNGGLRDPQRRFRVQVGHLVRVETPKQHGHEWHLGGGRRVAGPNNRDEAGSGHRTPGSEQIGVWSPEAPTEPEGAIQEPPQPSAAGLRSQK